MRARLECLSFDDEHVVEREQIGRRDLDLLARLAVECDRHCHLGPVFAAGLQVVGKRLDAERRVARGVPVGAVLAVIEHVLDQPRRQLAVGIGSCQQLQVERVGFDLAAVPAPPVSLVGELQVGSLVFIVANDVLADVLKHGRELGFFADSLEAQAEHGLGVDREVGAIAIEEGDHAVVANARVAQDHEDQGVDVIGPGSCTA